MVELASFQRASPFIVTMVVLSSAAWGQMPLEGGKAKRKPPSEGQLAPALGKLGPVSRNLRKLKGNVSTPVLRPNNLNETAQSPTKPSIVVDKPTLRPKTAVGANDLQSKQTAPAIVSPECRLALARISTSTEVEPPQSKDALCVVPDPVSVETINSTPNMGLSASPVLHCDFALAFAKFMLDTAQPLAKFHLNSAIESVQTGPGFTCRRRNNLATGKLSEHSFGNAIDIAAFKLADGRKIPVQLSSLHKADAAAFQSALRKAACGHFTTVLGPGSNKAHATHLHFDLGRSKGKKNPYRICE